MSVKETRTTVSNLMPNSEYSFRVCGIDFNGQAGDAIDGFVLRYNTSGLFHLYNTAAYSNCTTHTIYNTLFAIMCTVASYDLSSM